MRHPLHFDRSYSAEMLRNKVRLTTGRNTDTARGNAGRGEIPALNRAEKEPFSAKVTRIA